MSIPRIARHLLLFLFCLFASFGHYYFFLENQNISESDFLVPKGDAIDYIETARNALLNGCYCHKTSVPIPSNYQPSDYDKQLYFAFRTPGYVPIYAVSYLIYPDSVAKAITFFEMLLYSLAKVLLIIHLARLLKSIFWTTVFALLINVLPFLHFFEGRLLTEDFAVSFLVFSFLVFPLQPDVRFKSLRIFFSGVFMLEAILLRPFLAPLIILPLFWYVVKKINVKNVSIYYVPTFIFFVYWISRNFVLTNELIPLSSTLRIFTLSNKCFIEQRKICQYTGTEFNWYGKGNIVAWFNDPLDSSDPVRYLPATYFLNKSTSTELIKAKEKYIISLSSDKPLEVRQRAELISAELIKRLNDQYKSREPLDYYLISPLRVFRQMVKVPLQKPFINLRYPLNVISVFAEALAIQFVVIFGLFSIISFNKIWFHVSKNAAFVFTIVYILVLFMFFVKTVEVREFFIPLFLLCALAILFLKQLMEGRKYLQLLILTAIVLFTSINILQQNVKW